MSLAHWLTTPVSDLVVQPQPLDAAVTRLSLNASRIERVESAIRSLETHVRSDPGLRTLRPVVRLQGSVATRTAIKPIEADEFDADALLVVDVRKLPLSEISPEHVLRFVTERLGTRRFLADRMIPRERCVRINYAGEFHLDIVPVHADEPYGPNSSPLYLPNAKSGAWERTHPAAYTSWFARQDRLSNGRVRKAVILAKAWRNQHQLAVPSLLLTTVVADDAAVVKSRRTDEAFVAALVALSKRIGDGDVPNPSLPSENLARDLSEAVATATVQRARLDAYAGESVVRKPRNVALPVWRDLVGSTVMA